MVLESLRCRIANHFLAMETNSHTRPRPKMSEEFIAGYAIKFSDGGDPEMGFFHKGTKEECQCVLDLVPGIAYSGDRPGAEAHVFFIPSAELLPSQSQRAR